MDFGSVTLGHFLGGGAAVALAWYMLKNRDARLNNHSKALDEIKKDLTQNYLRKEDVNRALDQLHTKMSEMCAKIDRLLERKGKGEE